MTILACLLLGGLAPTMAEAETDSSTPKLRPKPEPDLTLNLGTKPTPKTPRYTYRIAHPDTRRIAIPFAVSSPAEESRSEGAPPEPHVVWSVLEASQDSSSVEFTVALAKQPQSAVVVSWPPPRSGAAPPGVYELSITVDGKPIGVQIELVAPRLVAPTKLNFRREATELGDDPQISPNQFQIHTLPSVSQLDGLLLTPAPAASTETTKTSELSFSTSRTRVPSTSSFVVKVSGGDSLPFGTSTGSVVLSAHGLHPAVEIPWEIRNRRHWIWIPLLTIAFVIIGHIVREILPSRTRERTLRREQRQLMKVVETRLAKNADAGNSETPERAERRATWNRRVSAHKTSLATAALSRRPEDLDRQLREMRVAVVNADVSETKDLSLEAAHAKLAADETATAPERAWLEDFEIIRLGLTAVMAGALAFGAYADEFDGTYSELSWLCGTGFFMDLSVEGLRTIYGKLRPIGSG